MDLLTRFPWLSLLPSLLIIFLAWKTKQILLSLIIGVFTGALILYNGNPLTAFLRTTDTYVLESMADGWNAAILIVILALGGTIGIITKAGGAQAIGDTIAKKAKTVKNAKLAAWLLGLAIFFDDYSNTLIVGNTMRPITDRMKIPREKLAYITDTTAAAVASLVPISTWIAYEVGLIEGVFSDLGISENAYHTFLKTIPYSFYSIFAIILVLLVIVKDKDMGSMYDAEVRAYKEGKVIREGSTPLASKEISEMEVMGKGITWIQAFIPIICIAIFTMIGLWYDGGGADGATLSEAFGNADSSIVLMWSAFGGTIIAGFIAAVFGKIKITDVVDSWVEGTKAMVIACLILVLAWSVGAITSDLKTAEFIIGIAEGNLPAFIIPAMIFVIAAFISFTTGTSWGTMAILMPLAIPLAHSLGGEMLPTIAAILTGSIWGDHCSPISDTTIMSSMSSGSDHIDHVQTQLPYAITGGVIALVIGFIPAGFGVPWFVSLPIGVTATYLVLNFFGKSVDPKDLDKLQQNKAA
ncbi:Na+/H+ antiporter NhaC family protein [Alkalicella caledoniensis]|uniref:Na+/H+ antiporter NhaC family protein n=1 Tax=Alkalicella caledoniensis TaxID=2731377 RepID=A0A7G9W7N5_ALKCA|nr:Na+/H+ antiporter NhaC family protein [Alkalicella caledoniensis]QNO14697.1 Na+/H+ antiporter NhaC family protein [Alkalicella caledoniensis]